MTPQAFLVQLHVLFTALTSSAVHDFIMGQDEATKARYVSEVIDLRAGIMDLENAQLSAIADKLDQLAPALQASIDALQQELNSLADAVTIVNTLSSVIGFATRLIAFAGSV